MKTCCDLHSKFRLEFRLEKSNQVDIEKSCKFPGVFAFLFFNIFLLTHFSWFMSWCSRGWQLPGAGTWGVVEASLGMAGLGLGARVCPTAPARERGRVGGTRATPALGIKCLPGARLRLGWAVGLQVGPAWWGL